MVGHLVAGLERPADERREPAGLVLQLTQTLKMLDRLARLSKLPKNILGLAAAAKRVPLAVHVQPVVGEHFAAREVLAHAVDQNLGPAARQASQAGRLQPLEHRSQWQL